MVLLLVGVVLILAGERHGSIFWQRRRHDLVLHLLGTYLKLRQFDQALDLVSE